MDHVAAHKRPGHAEPTVTTMAATASAPTPTALLRKLEWRVRRSADSVLGGAYRSAFRGRGREFDQVVRYTWGDDVRDIDWNVTARLGEPYRKKFVEERELTVAVLFEDAPSLQFGSGSRTKREVALDIAGYVALLSAMNRDRVGFWHATPQCEAIRPPARGRSSIVGAAVEFLGQPVPDLTAGGSVQIDWKQLYFAFPRHTVLLWLGDFAPRPLPYAWAALRRRYEVIGLRVEDPWERALPTCGRLAAVDPSTGELLPVNPGSRASRRRHHEWVTRRDAFWQHLFPRPLDALTVSTADDPLTALARLFRARMQAVRA